MGAPITASTDRAVRSRWKQIRHGGIAAWSRSTVRLTTAQQANLPEYAKGGELVPKPFAFTQAFAKRWVDALRRREEGQTMAEYGVVLAVITLAVVGSMTLLSDNMRSALESVASILPG